MSEHYYVVGVHGPPTKETAPHGFMVRFREDAEWEKGWPDITYQDSTTQWYPTPAPPTVEAPAPEPELTWGVCEADEYGDVIAYGTGPYDDPPRPLDEYADALNALDRDGVAWGKPRPMEELPEAAPLNEQHVLVRRRNGAYTTMHIETAPRTTVNPPVGWWPLPSMPEGGWEVDR